MTLIFSGRRMDVKSSDVDVSGWTSVQSPKNYTVTAMAFSPDSTRLAVAQSDCIVFVYKVRAIFHGLCCCVIQELARIRSRRCSSHECRPPVALCVLHSVWHAILPSHLQYSLLFSGPPHPCSFSITHARAAYTCSWVSSGMTRRAFRTSLRMHRA